jgi:hypothetical protein
VELKTFKIAGEEKTVWFEGANKEFLAGFFANLENQTVPDKEIEMMFFKAYDDGADPGLLFEMIMLVIHSRNGLAVKIGNQLREELKTKTWR